MADLFRSFWLIGASLAVLGCGSEDSVAEKSASDGGGVDGPAGPAGEQILEGVVAEPRDEARFVFDQRELRTYNIVVEPAELAEIDGDPALEKWVTGTLEFEGKTYGPLGVRYKGSVGAFLPPCTADSGYAMGVSRGPRTGKCSIKLDFDRVDPEGRFFGQKTLNLHSMNIDHTLMRDRLGYSLFRAFGLAAPRAVHARVLVNGELRGVYVAVEQIDGRFTKRRFVEGGDGNVYKEVWPNQSSPETYKASLETHADENPSVQTFVDFANRATRRPGRHDVAR